MTLTKTDIQTANRSALIFVAPLALLYLTQVTGTLQTAGHVISLKDFIPTSFTTGAVALYVVNYLTNLIHKFIA